MTNYIVTIILSVFGSVGFWNFINSRIEAKSTKNSAETELLIGLAHDRIYRLCEKYLDRGSITTGEYDNLMCIYRPYHKCGGNGTATKLIEQVDQLPISDIKEK